MSAARRKGNALELLVSGRIDDGLDDRDPRLSPLESAGGRLGGTYALRIDVAGRRFVFECKNREDNPARLWEWLDGLKAAAEHLRGRLHDPVAKVPVVVLKRNRRRPLVVLDLDDFERLTRDSRPTRNRVDL